MVTTEDAFAGVDPFETSFSWKAGAVAGLLATVAMGIAIAVMNEPTLRTAIAGLYGQEGSLVAGWTAHLAHGTLFGLIFAGVLTDPTFYDLTDSVPKTAALGVCYGLVLAIVGAGFIMPVWLSLVGFPNLPAVLNLNAPILGWHVIYGVALGGLYPILDKSL
jgi:hypothetical protein